MRLKEAFESVYKQRWSHQRDQDKVAQRWEGIRAFFGDPECHEIGPPELHEFADWRFTENDNSPATVNRYMSVLGPVLARGGNPQPMPRWKERGNRTRVLSAAEYAAIRDLLEGPHRALMVFLYETGCRPIEAYSLRRRDLLKGRGAHFAETKNGTERTIPLSRAADMACAVALEVFDPSPQGQVFQVHEWAFRRAFKAAALGALGYEDPGLTPYCLRHTRLTEFAAKVGNPFLLMQWAGHRDLQTSMKYIHLSGEGLEGALSLMETK